MHASSDSLRQGGGYPKGLDDRGQKTEDRRQRADDRLQIVQSTEYPPASPDRLAMAGRSNSRTRNRRMMK